MVDLAHWMRELSPQNQLSQVCLPGSHDAGLYKTSKRSGPMNPLVITQTDDVFNQLQNGARVFDLRFYPCGFGDKSVMRCGHFAEPIVQGRSNLGGFGPTIDEIFGDISKFMKGTSTITSTAASSSSSSSVSSETASSIAPVDPSANKETVIIRLMHIHSDHAKRIVEKVEEHFSEFLFKAEFDNFVNLAEIKLSELRGKVIAIFEADIFRDYRQPEKGIFTFDRTFPHASDLVLCGKFSNKYGLVKMREKQTERCKEHERGHSDSKAETHLSTLYWTLTGGWIWANTKDHLEWDLAKKLIHQYRPNIVFHDFCSAETCADIIGVGNGIY